MMITKVSTNLLAKLMGTAELFLISQTSANYAKSTTPWGLRKQNLSSLTSSNQQKLEVLAQQHHQHQDYPTPILHDDFTVEEVRIPTINGTIAGKLWKGSAVPSNNSNLPTTPLICMHGWLDNAGTFDPLLPLILKPTMTALAIDFPGHGYSAYHTPPVHYDAHIENMIALHSILQHYNWKKFTILGHSLGAIVGFVFAGVFPEVVDKFIALENVRPIPKDCISELRFAIVKLLELEKKRKLVESQPSSSPSYTYDEIVTRFFNGRNRTISLEACKILMKRGAAPVDNNNSSGNGLFRFTHDIRTPYPTGLWRFSPSHTEEIASAISCPVCFIKGEPGVDYEDRSKYDRIVELMQLSNSNPVEYHLVEGTHHFHLNNPFPVAPIINKFLDS